MTPLLCPLCRTVFVDQRGPKCPACSEGIKEHMMGYVPSLVVLKLPDGYRIVGPETVPA